ncbi:hypothetical protein P3L10_016888 [Capsicum annuum]
MSKRSRVSRSDSFDQSKNPSKNSSTDNSNKFFKPSSSHFNNYNNNNNNVVVASNNNNNNVVVAATAAAASSSSIGVTSYISDFLKECFYCKSILKMENDIYMYNSNPFCTEECRESQMAFDEDLMMMEQLEMDSDEDLMMEKLEISGKKNDEK